MNLRLLFIFLFLFNVNVSQNVSSINALKGILQTPRIVKYFENVISKVGVTIGETNETFTIEHTGNKILLSDGINDMVDYKIQLKLENIQNMVMHAKDGEIDKNESWKIINVLFTPMFTSTFLLTMNDPWRRKLSGLEAITHCYLYSSDNNKKIGKHTIYNLNNNLKVTPGIFDNPNRIYYLDIENALTFQRKMQKAIAKNSWFEWLSFARWFWDWREKVSIIIP